MANDTIWKYPIPVEYDFALTMPRGAIVLSVQVQNGQPCMWALVDSCQGDNSDRSFLIVETGHPIDPTGLRFVGTFQMYQGAMVFHLFEKEQSNVS